MSVDDTSFKFDGGSSWSFSAGDSIAISIDPASAGGWSNGDATFTIVLVLDWNNILAAYSGGGGGSGSI